MFEPASSYTATAAGLNSLLTDSGGMDSNMNSGMCTTEGAVDDIVAEDTGELNHLPRLHVSSFDHSGCSEGEEDRKCIQDRKAVT